VPQVSGSGKSGLNEIGNWDRGTAVKTTTLVMLLIVSLQAHAISIGLELPGADYAASDIYGIYDISKSADAPYLLQATSNFHLELPGILTGAHFCAVSDPSACGISSLMLMRGTVGSAGGVGATATTSGSIKASGASASRVPLPGTLGLFGSALLAFVVIRRKQSV
jgi:hypothetical protein